MKRLLIFCSFLLFIAATCERTAEINLPEIKPRLVVISNFTSNMDVQVEVTSSRGTTSAQKKEYIYDAIVEIYEANEFIEQFELVQEPVTTSPYYTSTDFVPEVGVVYNIKVEAPGFDPVMARSSIPEPIEISAFQVDNLEEQAGTNEGEIDYSFRVLLTFLDPEEETNYYHLRFRQQVHEIEILEGIETIKESKLEDIEFSSINDNNNTLSFFGGGILLEDSSFNGNAITNTFILNKTIQTNNKRLGQMFVELRTVSEEYYKYYDYISRLESSSGPPFANEVISYHNIENGLGVFAGYNMAVDSVQVIQ